MSAPAIITPELLASAGVQPDLARLHAPHLAEAAGRYGISTRERVAAFVGQLLHETVLLRQMEENLDYRTAARVVLVFGARRVGGLAGATELVRQPERLANRVYGGRYGNGDEASGDGWRYRGRGAGHLTFRANYRDAGTALGRPYEQQPELVALPADAALTFGWFWSTRNCNAAADRWDIASITRAINPGRAGANERWELCSGVLSCMPGGA
jgi:putative chitinase